MPPKKSKTTPTIAGRLVGGTFSELATYSDLFTHLGDAVFLLDLEHFNVLETNPFAQSLFTPGGGMSFFEWVDPADRARLQEQFASLKGGSRSTWKTDAKFQARGGKSVILEVSTYRLKLADYMEVLQVIGKDVTEVRQATLELAALNQKLEQLATTDEMTGLMNYRSFKNELEKEHERSQRYRQSYAVLFCDIDHFKNYNDMNGHPAGDEVLKRVAKILKKNTRISDLVARYGGEEFVVLCPSTKLNGALQVAEILRAAIESEIIPHGEKQPLGKLTLSIGAASFPENGTSAEEVLELADQGVYLSKKNGRNQVQTVAKKAKSVA